MSYNDIARIYNSIYSNIKKPKLYDKILIFNFLSQKEIINIKEKDLKQSLLNLLIQYEIIKTDSINDILLNYHFCIDNIKLINPKDKIIDILNYNNSQNIFNISIHPSLKGGIGLSDILDSLYDFIVGALNAIFEPITKPLGVIGDVFRFFIKIAVWIIKSFFWMIGFIIWAIFEILFNIPGDIVNAIKLIATSILLAIPEFLVGLMKMLTNTFVKYVFSGFWGWDTVPSDINDFKNSKFFKRIRTQKSNKKCYVNDSGSVPFSVIMGTIFMPPIGVFMTLGLTGWLHIIIAALLTITFYFPGLMYALIIVYC